MTWVKIDDAAFDDPRLLTLDRGVRLLHLEALAYSARHLTDGGIPRAALPRLTDQGDLVNAAKALVAAGLWEEADDGWRLVFLQKDQRGREEVEAYREAARQRSARNRQRKALHDQDDHSLCDYCAAKKRSRERSGEATANVRTTDPTRPSPKGGLVQVSGNSGSSRPEADARVPEEDGADDADDERSECGRCRGLLADEEGQYSEDEDDWFCTTCQKALSRWRRLSPGRCFAYAKAGDLCGSPAQKASLWCLYHQRLTARGVSPRARGRRDE